MLTNDSRPLDVAPPLFTANGFGRLGQRVRRDDRREAGDADRDAERRHRDAERGRQLVEPVR